MPEQAFTDTDTETGEEIVHLQWDFSLAAVEVRYRGTPIARVGDLAILRSDLGMSGPTPDGKALTIWAVRSSGAESFEATVDGEVLRPSAVVWTDAVEAPPDPSTLSRSERRARAKAEEQVRSSQGRATRSRRPVFMIVTLTVALAVGGVLYGWPRWQEASASEGAGSAPAAATPAA